METAITSEVQKCSESEQARNLRAIGVFSEAKGAALDVAAVTVVLLLAVGFPAATPTTTWTGCRGSSGRGVMPVAVRQGDGRQS